MMLRRHPGSPPSPAREIDVLATRLGDGKLSLLFSVSGDLAQLRLPTNGRKERKDGLWRHSCFEAFIRPPEGPDYFELNLSPSGDWAAYRFDDYRTGIKPLEIPAPIVESQLADDHLGVVASIDLANQAPLSTSRPWLISCSRNRRGACTGARLRALDRCETCKGSGAAPGTEATTCPQCEGRGEVRSVRQTMLGQMVNVSPCPRCRGASRRRSRSVPSPRACPGPAPRWRRSSPDARHAPP